VQPEISVLTSSGITAQIEITGKDANFALVNNLIPEIEKQFHIA
jgi:ABC-type xylose transport system substrate-binding protein